jgi:hypothetical protein
MSSFAERSADQDARRDWLWQFGAVGVEAFSLVFEVSATSIRSARVIAAGEPSRRPQRRKWLQKTLIRETIPQL